MRRPHHNMNISHQLIMLAHHLVCLIPMNAAPHSANPARGTTRPTRRVTTSPFAPARAQDRMCTSDRPASLGGVVRVVRVGGGGASLRSGFNGTPMYSSTKRRIGPRGKSPMYCAPSKRRAVPKSG